MTKMKRKYICLNMSLNYGHQHRREKEDNFTPTSVATFSQQARRRGSNLCVPLMND